MATLSRMSSSAGMTSYGLCFRSGSKAEPVPARRRWEWSEPSSPEPVSCLPRSPHPPAANTASEIVDFSDSLPDEVLLLVLSRLRSRVDRDAAATVCKRWLQVEAGLRTALHLSVTECSPSRTPKPERGCMDRVLLYMLGRLTNLREIQLVNLIVPGESTFTDKGMEAIGLSCPKLRKFHLKVSSAVTARGITALVSGCGTNLRELSFHDCVAVDEVAMRAIAGHCKHLEALTVRACTAMDDAALLSLTRGASIASLERLEVYGITDRGLEALASALPNLCHLDVSRCDVTDRGLSLIAFRMPALRSLVARAHDLTNTSCKALALHAQELVELDLRRAKFVTGAGLVLLLEGCSKLKRLWVDADMLSMTARQLAEARGVEVEVTGNTSQLTGNSQGSL